MKTKFYVLFVSAALIVQAQAGGHHGGGGRAGGHFAAARSAPARGGAIASFHSRPMRTFGRGRGFYSSPRFSSSRLRPAFSGGFRQAYIHSNRVAPIRTPHFTGRTLVRNGRFNESSNGRTGAMTNLRRNGNAARQIQSRRNLPPNWRNHVFAQHSADWHRNWDRNHEHWWHGHPCRFVNGSWIVFDLGFVPWWPYWWYPDGYYAYDYYPYPDNYGLDYYDSSLYPGEEYYDQNNGYNEPYAEPTVAAAQEQLSRQGYYRGEIDGIFGPETRLAVSRYQRDHDLRVTGYLTADTLEALGVQRVAAN
jgi:Putative peptidoglycan binding domain